MTTRDRILAWLGALIGISATGLITGLVLGRGAHLPLIIAPMGATAVLLFAVPASPLVQPWSIVGGNTISAVIGVIVARTVAEPVVATGLAVSLAIFVMSQTRCLHPPGGASALTAVLGGAVVTDAGLWFPFVPVALNSITILVVGLVFHRLARRTYPHRPVATLASSHGTADPPPQLRAGVQAEDIEAVLGALDEPLDIDREDLVQLLDRVTLHAAARAAGPLRCGELMSRDVITVDAEGEVEAARASLIEHDVRIAPAVRADGTLVGTVTLRDLVRGGGRVADHIGAATTARRDDPALELVPTLSDRATRMVVVVDDDRRVVGVITQTDMLAAIARTLPHR